MGEFWDRIMKHFGGKVVGQDYAFIQELRYDIKEEFREALIGRNNVVTVAKVYNKWFGDVED